MDIFLLFLLAFPAFGANMIPVVAARWNWFPCLDRPIDGEKMYRGHRILGAHKTWRGLIVGTVFGGVVGGGLFFVDALFHLFSLPLESVFDWIFFGLLSGFGALFGDALKSFFKRQVGIGSGKPFLPFDQIDYIFGFLVFTLPLISWGLGQVLVFLSFGLLLNPLVNFIGYILRIKKTFW